jgi:hypothetical protein
MIPVIEINILNDSADETDARYKEQNIETDVDLLLQMLSEEEAYVTDINVDMWKVVTITLYRFVDGKKIPSTRIRVSCYRFVDALVVALLYITNENPCKTQ